MTTTYCGFVAILGAANVGKSTLTNVLTREKVSIISSKPNTTRGRVYGITTTGDHQVILVDTPGLIMKPQGMLHRYMTKTVWQSGRQADLCLVLVDAHYPCHDVTQRLLKELSEKDRRIFLLLNKIDGMKKEALLPLAAGYSSFDKIEKVFMISGKTGSGLEDLERAIWSALPEGPWLFPKEALTQLSQKTIAAEITREKLFECLHQEVPYGIHVETDLWHVPGQDTAPPDLKIPKTGISIFQTIFVEKEGYRKLILGQKGQRLAHVGKKAREELMQRLGKTVHLFLHIKVSPAWREHSSTYRSFES